jgi:DNA-directed RNA polymerase specialized sigma24 family protein
MQQVLEMHYVYHKPWEAIAEEMNCIVSNVYKLHNRALREIKVPDLLQNHSRFQ